MFRALKDVEAIQSNTLRPLQYAALKNAENPLKYGAFHNDLQERVKEIEKELIFFDLELLELSEEKLQALSEDPALENYSHYIAHKRKEKAHKLSEENERLMKDKSTTSKNAFRRLFRERFSRKKFEFIPPEGEKKMLALEEVASFLHDPDRSARKAAASALTKGIQDESHILTFIFNVLGKDKEISDRWFQFGSPEASRHLDNEIDQETVDTLVAVVQGGYGIVQDYYRFKRLVLGYDTLYDYDRYAPINETHASYSFDEAREMVLKAFGRFSPVYAETAGLFFKNHWIDAEVYEGKDSGAFCSYYTCDHHPYVFLSYHGRIRDIETLAHELGHGIHGYVSRSQTQLNYEIPLTMAEIASIFGEQLVFDDLKKKLSGDDLLLLLMGKIEEIFATVFRQISMYQFEKRFHDARRGKELTTQEINEIWRGTQIEMFGDAVVMTKEYDFWWSYIPHFINAPFYVYAYAFGQLLTMAIYAKFEKEGNAIADAYLNMLCAAGSKSPDNLVKPLGIDLHNKEFWQGGIDMIAEMVEEAKRLFESLPK